jgi:hypothetical protein
VHGRLGWLAAVALVHPAIVLRRTKRKAHLSVALLVAIVSVVFGIGLAIYTGYRERLGRGRHAREDAPYFALGVRRRCGSDRSDRVSRDRRRSVQDILAMGGR